ncbi:site-specific integrase [bacterium CPR1]|nr:site-specific integrase [bacterium CPR1]
MRGHITKRGDTYRVEIHLGYDKEGKRMRHRKTLSTKKAAQKYLRDKLDEFETEGGIRERNLQTLGAFLKRWLEGAKLRVRQRTHEEYCANVERYVGKHDIGKKLLTTVNPIDIQELYTEITARGTGPYAIRKLHSILRQALQQAVKWRELHQNPALFVDLPRITRKRELRVLHSSDLAKFVQAALQELRLGAMWVLALATGMRPEEYLGLFWSDFSLDFRKVTVNRALVRFVRKVEGLPKWRFEPPKTDKSRRTLALEPEMAELLRQHRDQQNIEKEYAGSAYEDLGLVFANELGGPLYLDNLRARNFKRVLQRAGLPSNLTVYSLRHSAATALLKDRESLKVVSELLGHSTIRLTGDVYSHVSDDMLEEASAKLGKRMFQ